MLRRIQNLLLILLVLGCVEPYEFVIRDNEPTMVIEAFVSDKSFNETLDYPSDGRYFAVKLSTTTDVLNVRPRPVLYAQVHLFDDRGNVWEYTESGDTPGLYLLLSHEFKAEVGVAYKLSVSSPNESIYESDWQSLPSASAPPIGNISFREDDIQKYVVKAREEVLETVRGVWADIAIPENTTNEQLYYRWTYTPHWIYVAPFASNVGPRTCWAYNPLTVQNYAVQLDRTGNYKKDLFFLETVGNVKIFERYSSLIVQHAMTEEFYFFWKEMQEQNEGGAIFDKPPFNLHTNFHSLDADKKVSGYFGVLQEQATRWYFDKSMLSYHVENTLRKDCSQHRDMAPECLNCTAYSFGIATTEKPIWWED